MRYFYSELASRPIEGGGIVINFTKTGIFGSNICGIYATDNPTELSVLDGVIAARAGVIETSKEDYDIQVAQKKTIHSLAPSLTLRAVPQVAAPQSTVTVAERQGAVSAASEQAQSSSKPSTGKIEDPLSLIKVDSVNSPGLITESQRTEKVDVKPKKANVKANKVA